MEIYVQSEEGIKETINTEEIKDVYENQIANPVNDTLHKVDQIGDMLERRSFGNVLNSFTLLALVIIFLIYIKNSQVDKAAARQERKEERAETKKAIDSNITVMTEVARELARITTENTSTINTYSTSLKEHREFVKESVISIENKFDTIDRNLDEIKSDIKDISKASQIDSVREEIKEIKQTMAEFTEEFRKCRLDNEQGN